ncbi:MAG: hypothetical protein K1X79_03775 [Oligoflexia bacterium]|nr:hypothetical protein [Oligoflexia bacterium]
MTQKQDSSSKDKDRGLYMILVSFFMVSLTGLCALIFGLAALAFVSSRLSITSDMVAMAIMSRYFTTQGTYFTKAAAAATRGEEVLRENGYIPFVGSQIMGLGLAPTPGASGSFGFQNWYPEMPNTLGQQNAACGSNPNSYPCLRPLLNPNANSNPNAVQVNLKTQNTNPLIAPFARIFGSDRFRVQSQSFAASIQRCAAMLLDVSFSTIGETHQYNPLYLWTLNNPPPPHPTIGANWQAPVPPAMYAYFLTPALPSITPPAVPGPSACSDWMAVLGSPAGIFAPYFCAQPRERLGAPVPATGPYLTHYIVDDYRIRNTDLGPLLIDTLFDSYNTYFGPLPLSRFYLAFNVSLRAVDQIKATSDKAMVYAFTGQRVGSEPVVTPGQPQQLTTNLPFLIQLTNMANIGWHDVNGNQVTNEVSPNFASRGWFPIASGGPVNGRTNIAQALYDAIDALSTCPKSAKKVIILASDGIQTCGFNPASPDPSVDCFASSMYENYKQAKQVILNNIVPTLSAYNIAVTTLLDSDQSPAIANVTATPGTYVDPSKAGEMGFYGLPPPAPTPGWNKGIVKIDPDIVPADATAWADPACTPAPLLGINCAAYVTPGANPNDTNHLAFLNSGRPGYAFRDPAGLWAQVAIDTGGVVCNLMNPCDPSWYDNSKSPPELYPTARAGQGAFLNCNPYNEPKHITAMKCALSAVGINAVHLIAPSTPTP